MNDITIIGGGISGLYFLYKYLLKKKKNEKIKIGLYEKNNYFGGRIFTFYTKINNYNFRFETGAARLCKEKHKRFYNLILKMGLKKYLIKGSAKIHFIPSTNDYLTNKDLLKISKKSPYVYINKVLLLSKLYSKNVLMKYSFIEFVTKYRILSKNQIQYLRDSFGYSAEIESMNAFNALHMFRTDLNKKYNYYSLKCGLSKLIEKMILKIKMLGRKKNCVINLYKNSEIKNLKYNEKENIFIGNVNNKKICSKKVFCAIQQTSLLKLPILKPFYKTLRNSIQLKSLCRIYMIFKDGSWMSDLKKITTNTHNRYLIPLNVKKGSVMISYTDSKYANHLNNYYKKYGKKRLEKYILESWENTLLRNIPEPIFTKVCYWKEGVAMWNRKINSIQVHKMLQKPFMNKDLYISGENYSLNQAWIEGGLQNSDEILSKYF